jgi:hypothetical protein
MTGPLQSDAEDKLQMHVVIVYSLDPNGPMDEARDIKAFLDHHGIITQLASDANTFKDVIDGSTMVLFLMTQRLVEDCEGKLMSQTTYIREKFAQKEVPLLRRILWFLRFSRPLESQLKNITFRCENRQTGEALFRQTVQT